MRHGLDEGGHAPGRRGLTHQVFKSALAASAAHALAYRFVARQFPVFAPMAALLTIQVTVFNSYSRGVQRILAIVVGVGLALLAFRCTGANAWIIFLVTFAALAIGTRLGLGIAAINQVPMSALLILAAKAYVSTYALVVNLLLWPPTSLPAAERAVDRLRQGTEDLLNRAADVVMNRGETPALDLIREARRVDTLVAATKKDIASAGQSLKLNPRARALSPQIARCQALTALHERVAVQARGVAKSVGELRQAPSEIPYRDGIASLVRSAADAVAAATLAESGTEADGQTLLASFERRYRDVSSRALRAFQNEDTPVWARYGSILSDARHLVRELVDDGFTDARSASSLPGAGPSVRSRASANRARSDEAATSAPSLSRARR
jgi:hypothetical protein